MRKKMEWKLQAPVGFVFREKQTKADKVCEEKEQKKENGQGEQEKWLWHCLEEGYGGVRWLEEKRRWNFRSREGVVDER